MSGSPAPMRLALGLLCLSALGPACFDFDADYRTFCVRRGGCTDLEDYDGGPVTGERATVFATESSTTAVPREWAGETVSALVMNGSEATVYPGTPTGPGRFVIPDVPPGEYYLVWPGSVYVVTARRHLDLSSYDVGRYDAAPSGGAAINLALSDASPWQDKDALQAFSAGAGTMWTGPRSPYPDAGVTELAQRVSWGGNLVEASKQDSLVVTQLSPRRSGTLDYQAVVRAYATSTLTMSAGSTATVSGVMTTPPFVSLQLAWQRSAFERLRSAIHPSAQPGEHDLLIDAVPTAGITIGDYSTPDLIVAGTAADAGTDDLSLALDFGNPFPSTWPRVAYASAEASVDYLAAGATRPSTVLVRQYHSTRVTGSSLTLGPLLGPPTSPRLNGLDAFGPLGSVGLTPLLEWRAPSGAVPSGYRVRVSELVNASGYTLRRTQALFYTARHELRLPAGVLKAGGLYYASITAVVQGQLTLDKTPFLSDLPAASTTVMTGPFAP